MADTDMPRRRWLRVALRLSVLVLLLPLAELAARLLPPLVGAEEVDWRERRGNVISGSDEPDVAMTAGVNPDRLGVWSRPQEAMHPYTGYVLHPDLLRVTAVPPAGSVGRYGFADLHQPAAGPSAERLDVAVFGGSVAGQIGLIGGDALGDALARVPELAGRRIVVHALGIGGYKQPQQLFALTYLLFQGVHFDVVVNFDGYNEVALPPVNNVPKGVAAAYPKNWYFRVQSVLEPQIQVVQGKVAYLRARRVAWAQRFQGSWLEASALANLVWQWRDSRFSWRLLQEQVALHHYRPEDDLDYTVTGPVRAYADDDEMYRDLARIWESSSRQMHRLCKASRIHYLHFLQPNQYIAPSKPMSDAERAIAIRDDQLYVASVRTGYGYLQDAGARLAAEGVRFHDLTPMFAGFEPPVWSDSCCHLNERGCALVAERIASEIAAAW